ncbi:hypothetical protein [Mobilicoccus pelagius]|uniref:Uncharacterized protein n=1 Tax=Mobilicoccus pelagius NBRC 104925 TaxID=1089455 RepID=H5UU22_9MICO|nr:hypothetical protein [Mobilicoccus pelagius]GAB49230.1 hypothetical protein MOPEL_099_00300 [Mobilicoccus pelagius NBRC 104925]
MAGNSYPHIIFAKDAQVLPQQALADELTGMFPGAEVEQGEIKAVLRLPHFAYTFWYDDDADGLGERYADFATPLRRKRVMRCTTMIDASGDADPDGAHADDVARIMDALARRDGVYVFSEETKRFLGMDYDGTPEAAPVVVTPADATTVHDTTTPAHDASAPVESTTISEVAAETGSREEEFVSSLEGGETPAANLQSTYSNPAHVEAEHSEVVLESEERSGDLPHTEVSPVDGTVPPAPAGTPVPDTTPTAGGDAVHEEHPTRTRREEHVEPREPVTTPHHDVPATSTGHVETVAPATPTPAPESRPTTPEPVTESAAETEEEQGRPGFFKRFFKRKG